MSLIVFAFLIIISGVFLIEITGNKVFIFHGEYLRRGVLSFVLGGLILHTRGTFLRQEERNYKDKWCFKWKGVLNWTDKERGKIRKKEKRKGT